MGKFSHNTPLLNTLTLYLPLSYGKILRQVGLVTTIPMIFVAGPLVGYWIGQWIDGRFGIDPWGKVVVSLLGFVASLKQVVTIIQRSSKETEGE